MEDFQAERFQENRRNVTSMIPVPANTNAPHESVSLSARRFEFDGFGAKLQLSDQATGTLALSRSQGGEIISESGGAIISEQRGGFVGIDKGLPVNTAAGLEAGLIAQIRPEWNILGASKL